jgi:hypothetical protein
MDDLPQLRAVCAIGFENHNGTSSFQADIGCFDPGRRQQIRSQSSCTVFGFIRQVYTWTHEDLII